MATETRLYHVVDTETGKETLVEAALPAQARSIVTKSRFTADPVSGIEVARLTAAGVPVIWMNAEAAEADA